MTKKVAFAREATGIVRELGVWDVFLISAAIATLQPNFLWLFSWPDLTFPGSSPFWICTFALAIVIPIGLVYVLLGASMPRSGGDYVYTSRILRADIGFMSSFVVGMTILIVLGTDMMYMVSTAVAPTISVAGVLFANPSLLDLAKVVSSPMNTFAVGAVLLILITGLAMTRVITATRITWVFMLLSILGGVITVGLLLGTTREAFISIWNTKMGSYATYDQLINIAKGLGWAPTSLSIWASLSAMGFGMWLFYGWIFPAYVGGEVKRASRSMLFGIIGGILFLWLFFWIVGELSWAVAGREWISAVNWLATNYPDKYPIPSYPWISFVTPLLTDNPILIWLMLISYISAWVANDIAKILCATRIIFAWSFDRVVPHSLANVSERFHAPTWAAVVTGIIAIISLYVAIFTGIFGYYLNTAGMILIAYTIVSIAAIVFPFRRKEIFEASPSIVRTRVGGVPLISIIGVISAGFSIYGSYFALTTTILGPLNVASYSTIAGLFILGAIIYYFAKTYRSRREGIDLGLLIKEIPPE